MSTENHLLVFGASGVSGWAAVKEALSYPTHTTFASVTGLTNRPLPHEASYLPSDPRLSLVSGIDLTQSVDAVISSMKSKLPHIAQTTHVIFTAYIEKPTYSELRAVNTSLVQTAISAVDSLAGSNLKGVVLQTGGKAYGVEFPDKVEISPPLKESQPRIPKPYYDDIFYYFQTDALKELSKGKSWTFNETRPDVIVGFTPGSNFMNIAQGLGLWLSLAREVHGGGAKIPFPGTSKSWHNKHTDTFQDILAQMNIHAALNSAKSGNGATFNVANADEPVTWADKWPGICSAFGLEGVAPDGNSPYSVEEYVKAHQKEWDVVVQKHALQKGLFEKFSWKFLYGVMTVFDFDRQYDLSAGRNAGFKERVETVEGYKTAFERMRVAKIIP